MPKFRLSTSADGDIVNIAHYTVKQFGIKQARIYRDLLDACFKTLAENPALGKSVNNIRKGLRRFDHRSHAIFYNFDGQDILVIRVLHKSMDASQHL